MVKAAFPIIPMISDYFFSDPAGMTIEERFNQESMKVIWNYIAKVGGRVLHLDAEEWSEELLTPALLCHKEPVY